jgi:peptidoglycan/LPS O-acetylase OafA/YrhL
VYNFWAINNGQSYFQQFGGASPFTHLWSLSIEGQFYFVWPFVVWGVLKLRIKKRYIFLSLLLLSGMSAILMAVLYQPNAINRVYYGTDTRLFAVLLGSALAFVWSSTALRPVVNNKARNLLNSTGIISLMIVIGGFFVAKWAKRCDLSRFNVSVHYCDYRFNRSCCASSIVVFKNI